MSRNSDGSIGLKLEKIQATNKSANGKYYSILIWEGFYPDAKAVGRTMFFHDTETCPLVVGKEYRIIDTRKDDGTVFVRLWTEKTNKQWSKPDPQIQFKIEALKCAIDLLKADKIKNDQLEIMAKKLFKVLNSQW